MVKEVLPQMEISVNQLQQQVQSLDIFINAENFQKNVFQNFDHSLKLNQLFLEEAPHNVLKKRKSQTIYHKTLESSEQIIQKLPQIQKSVFQTESDQVIPYSHFYSAPNINLELIGHSDIVTFVCLIDYYKFATASGDYTIKIWDLDKQKCVGTLKGHVNDVWGITNVGQNLIASCSSDKSIKIWNIDNLECIQTLVGHPEIVKCIVFNPQTKKLYSGGKDNKIKQWNLQEKMSEKVIGSHQDCVKSIIIIKNTNFLASASADKSCKLWDLEKCLCFQTLEGHRGEVNIICELGRKDNKLFLASGGFEGDIIIWNAFEGAQIRTIKGHNGAINGLVQVEDLNILISVSSDKLVKVWNCENNKFQLKYNFKNHNQIISHCQYHFSRNLIITASWDNVVRAFSVKQNQSEQTIVKQTSLSQFMEDYFSADQQQNSYKQII